MKENLKPNTEVLVSLIAIGLLLVISGLCLKAFVLCVGALIFWAVAYPMAMYKSKKNFKEQEARRIREEECERRRIARAEEKKRLQRDYDKKIYDFEIKYGKVSKSINFGSTSNFNDNVIFFYDAKIVVINGLDIPFGQIMSFQHVDNKRIIKGTITYRTQTDNSDMINRAAIGYLFDGNRGLDIGAKTADRITIGHQEPDKCIHNHEIIVTINSFDYPILRIKIGYDNRVAEELNSLFSIIINQNKNK